MRKSTVERRGRNMSIEQQLSKAFKHNEASLQCPPSLDTRIMAEYERMAMDKGRNVYMKKQGRLPKIAVIALVVVLLCGFAYGSKFIFSDSTNRLSVQLQSTEAYHLTSETLEKTRATLKEVQSQLAPGETAIVYLTDVFKDYPIYGVTNLDYIHDIQQWQLVLDQHGVTEALPDSLLEGTYQFEAGALNNPFHPLIGWDQDELLAEMEAEQKTSEHDKLIWRLTDLTTVPDISLYTSVYRAGNGEELYLSWQIYDFTTFKIENYTSPSTEYEEYDLNGKKAHYTQNNQSLLAENGVLQSVMWMAEKDDKSIMYMLESDSPNMTKEKLIEAVKSLQ